MNFTTLDLDTLRTLAVARDLGGYGEAGARLGRTPSAISLQMKRLQRDVGARLFRKQGRGVALTEAGELVLGYARRMLALNDELLDTVRGAALVGNVRLGFSQDFADIILPVVLARFAALYPLVMVEVRIEGNDALVEAVVKDQLDVALAVGHADQATAESVGTLDLVWIAGERFVSRPDQSLPLVLLGPQCAFRKEAIRSLDAAGISWRVAAVSPSVAGVWAAAIGGLGITMRSALGLPQALSSGKAMFNLPRLGEFPVTMHARIGRQSEAVERLRAIVREAVREGLPRAGAGTAPTRRRTRATTRGKAASDDG
ncbi:MAG: LysR substrate-binding domain-containing protein [bacterium]